MPFSSRRAEAFGGPLDHGSERVVLSVILERYENLRMSAGSLGNVSTATETPQRQQRALQTRAQIIRGGAKAFVKNGYEGATLAAIQKETQVSNGAFYFHFATRQSLALTVLEEYEDLVRRIVTAEASASSALESLISASLRFSKAIKSDPIAQAGVVLSTERSSLPERSVRQAYDVWRDQVTMALTLAQQQGDLRDDVDVAELSMFFVASFTGIQLASAVNTRRRDLIERVRAAWMLLLPGLVPNEHLHRMLDFVSGPAKQRTRK